MKSKRFLCLLLVLLMVFSLTPSETRAETTVYFTAVNDQLLPDLSDETMPFWSGGRLYVPSTVITGTDLGLFYSRSRDKSTAVVYRQGSALTFNFAAGTVADQNDRQYSGPAIVRSDVVFLPLDLLTQFFSLDYSYTRVTYGYLVRVKSDTVVLSDAKFIDAAAMSMEQRYNEYMKTHSDSNDPGNTPDQNTDGDRDPVCLALRVTDEESANVLLDTLASDNATATFLFSEEQLSSPGDLLRRVVISGNAAALRIGQRNGGHDAERRRIERGGKIELRSGHGLAFGIVADLRHGGCAPACLIEVRRARGDEEQQAVCRADALVKAVLRERAQQGRRRRLGDVIQPQMAHLAAAQVTVHRRSRRHNGKPVALHEQGVGEFIGILRGRSR